MVVYASRHSFHVCKTSNKTWIIIGLVVFVLLIMWMVGYLVLEIAGAIIHILLVIALIALIIGFVLGRRTA